MIVLDCSAAIAMALGAERGAALKALALEGEKTIAPRLFCSELAHSLHTYVKAGELTVSQAIEKGNYALQLVDELYDDEALWAEAFAQAQCLGHSSYDLFYFVLARRNAATLFTLDERPARICNEQGVSCIQETAF